MALQSTAIILTQLTIAQDAPQGNLLSSDNLIIKQTAALNTELAKIQQKTNNLPDLPQESDSILSELAAAKSQPSSSLSLVTRNQFIEKTAADISNYSQKELAPLSKQRRALIAQWETMQTTLKQIIKTVLQWVHAAADPNAKAQSQEVQNMLQDAFHKTRTISHDIEVYLKQCKVHQTALHTMSKEAYHMLNIQIPISFPQTPRL